MKVLHLNTHDTRGGAAKGTYYLHQALQKSKIESHILVADHKSSDPTVLGPNHFLTQKLSTARYLAEKLPLQLYPKRDKESIFSTAWAYRQIRHDVCAIAPDIVNLHWVCGGFLGPESLQGLNIPLVWTLRDMWAFTGGCHYTDGCTHYEHSCGTCPKLGSTSAQDISNALWKRKKEAWKETKFTFVAISQWLADCARQSSLFNDDCDIRVIHNAIDEQIFKATAKTTARAQLGLDQDKKIIMTIALNILEDKRKGFQYVEDAVKKLSKLDNPNDWELMIVGSQAPAQDLNVGIKTSFKGKISDKEKLALFYSAADVAVIPSIQEGFGKTAIEALSCGTPIVCFNTTGLKDIVEHQKNGYAVKCFDADDMAHGLFWILAEKTRFTALCKYARKKVEDEFTLAIQSQKYIDLYNEILEAEK